MSHNNHMFYIVFSSKYGGFNAFKKRKFETSALTFQLLDKTVSMLILTTEMY